jgi:hypothetical protein
MYVRTRVIEGGGGFYTRPYEADKKMERGSTNKLIFLSFFNKETDRRRLEMMIHGERTP